MLVIINTCVLVPVSQLLYCMQCAMTGSHYFFNGIIMHRNIGIELGLISCVAMHPMMHHIQYIVNEAYSEAVIAS